jgi:hypothetical protein
MIRARVVTLSIVLVASVAATAPAQVAQKPAPAIRPAGSTPTLGTVTPPPALKAALAAKNKKAVQPSAIGQHLSYRGKTPLLRVPAGQFALEPVDMPGPTLQEIQRPALPPAIQKKYGPFIRSFQFGRTTTDKLTATVVPPPKNDHRSNQSPIRNQASRGTCTAHAAVAAIEAAYKKRGQTIELSENHAYNVFMSQLGSTCVLDHGVPTWKSASWLTSNRICTEAESPYVPDELSGNCATVQIPCASNRRHGFTSTLPLFGHDGGAGVASINNTSLLESFIDAGFDIVGGFEVAGTDWSDGTAESGVIDVQVIPGIGPVGSSGGHAMLIVGYDRDGQYFIAKNSWGAGFGHAGYAYLSYDYVQTYARYGYVVMGVTPG